MAMEQQMEMFAVGGLDDDGLSRDPVSGNEIPPGSMANEVRDDVEARLSDGEYVVPANVVRFFGVKFFEDLRTQAMQGLGAMEANGRIGGEPMPSDMPMQDQMAGVSEADMQMLQSMMNEGGYVQGYAHGGSHETPEYASTAYNPDQYPLTSTYGTVGGSYFNSLLNPNAPVDPNILLPPLLDSLISCANSLIDAPFGLGRVTKRPALSFSGPLSDSLLSCSIFCLYAANSSLPCIKNPLLNS